MNWHDDDVMLGNCDIIVFFPIYSWFAAIWESNSGHMVYKNYIFISNKHFILQKLKTELIFLLLIFYKEKKADISKIKAALVFKGIFSKTQYACVAQFPTHGL